MKEGKLSIEKSIEATVKRLVLRSGVSIENPLLVAVSGGADSMALLNVLVRIDVPIHAAHCNFHLRGEESNRDARFVENDCRRLSIRLHKIDFDTFNYMQTQKVSLEVACRNLRYQWFYALKEKFGFCRIALAHHRDDNAETLLLNLMRGAGAEGLKGMEPDTGNLLRPLLQFSKSEILEYMDVIGAKYITDSSNLESKDADRNFLRLEVLPLLRKRWPGIDKSLETARRNASRAATICKAYMESFLSENNTKLTRSAVMQCADAPSLVHAFIAGRCKSASQEEEIAQSMVKGNGTGQKWYLHNEEIAIYSNDTLHIIPNDNSNSIELTEKYLSKNEIEEELKKLVASSDNRSIILPFPLSECTLRPMHPGERIKPFGFKGRRGISQILHEAGIPPQQRKNYLVLAYKPTDEVVWIPGIRRSAAFQIGEDAECAWLINMG